MYVIHIHIHMYIMTHMTYGSSRTLSIQGMIWGGQVPSQEVSGYTGTCDSTNVYIYIHIARTLNTKTIQCIFIS